MRLWRWIGGKVFMLGGLLTGLGASMLFGLGASERWAAWLTAHEDEIARVLTGA